MAAAAVAIVVPCAPGVVTGPPYTGRGRALGSGDLHSDEGGTVRAPKTGAAVDLAFRTGSADFVGTRDLGATDGAGTGASWTSALALVSAGWRTVAAAARRLAMPLRAGRAGSRSLRAAKKARCRKVRALVVVDAGGLLWKPSAGCKTGEVELPDRNSGANFGRARDDGVCASDGVSGEAGTHSPQGGICMIGFAPKGWKPRLKRKKWRLSLALRRRPARVRIQRGGTSP